MSIRYNDVNAQSLNIFSEREVNYINNGRIEYYQGAFNCDGGATIGKGIKIGYQEKLVSGLVIYDNENFYGYSEKYGLSLLSLHQEYTELMFDEEVFDNHTDVHKITPSVTSNGKDMVKINNDFVKIKNIDIHIDMKDLTKYYIIVPKKYIEKNFILNLNFLIDINEECVIKNLDIVIINESNKIIKINIDSRKNIYIHNFDEDIEGNEIRKILFENINDQYFLLDQKKYKK